MNIQKSMRAEDLGINLLSKKESELFKWFLACLFLGKPIQQKIVKRTFWAFEEEGLTSPDALINAGWNKLVEVLDKGHYTRYDHSTATKLLEISRELKNQYGTVTNLINQSKSLTDLSHRLQEFKGVGPKTVTIFLDELAEYIQFNV